MAYQIFWKFSFVSLRAATVYTVNIWKDGTLPSGYPLTLKGGAQPFTTQEDDDEDMFTPIRTQTGYLRIVDDGQAVNSGGTTVSFNWKEMLPTTDTDRPVTLTHQESGQTVVDWQGYMQAQDFGSVLYGNPQEREFPIQCVLSVLDGVDINYTQKELQNFAYLLKQIVDGIAQEQRPTNFAIQGGSDAQVWLMKLIDWQNFTTVDNDSKQYARFTLHQCLEDMCRFWGWTARTMGSTLYLTSADDSNEQSWLLLTYAQLTTMAGGTAAGDTSGAFTPVTLSGDIFASTNNDDFIQRGYNKSTVAVDCNMADAYLIDPFDAALEKEMKTPAWSDGYIVDYGSSRYVHYSQDVLDIERFYLDGEALENYAAFNFVSKYRGMDAGGGYEDVGNCVSIKKTYTGSVFVKFYTLYEHCFHDGFFRMSGDVYRAGERYDSTGGRSFSGNADMWMRLGIGKTRATAKWWNGKEWVNSETTFRATIGNRDSEIFTRWWTGSVFDNAVESNIISVNNLSGLVFVEILGSNSTVVDELNNEKCFEIKDFKISFTKNNTVAKTQYPNSGWWDITELDRPDTYSYNSTNNNRVRNEYNVDAIYGSENGMLPAYSILINPSDNSYLTTISYGGTLKHPEQYLADRVTTYWGTAKRRISAELRSDRIGVITPQCKVTIDLTTTHPISISHEWRDDVTELTMLEIP